MTLDDTKTVITPEQVAITYRLAGIATRFAAVLMDTLIQGAMVLLLIGALLLLFPAVGWNADMLKASSPWIVAVMIIAGFAVLWGYFILFETAWSGRTPGKRLTGIRVVRDSGHPIDFRAAFLRNICRYVDFLPGAYGVGATVMFLSRESKRLGDYVAGTVVVVDAAGAPLSPVAAGQGQTDFRLLGDPSLLNLQALTREQMAVVDRFLERRETLVGAARNELARTVGRPLLKAIGLPGPEGDYPYEQFLEELQSAARARRM